MTQTKHDFMVLGVNHTTAPVLVRERITFPGNQDGAVTRLVAQTRGIEECVILSTCNRAEIIAAVDDSEEVSEDSFNWLLKFTGLERIH
jgi:glutamyl-tRNA reductase